MDVGRFKMTDISVDDLSIPWVRPKQYRSVADFAIYRSYGRWKHEYITCNSECNAESLRFITGILNKFRCTGRKNEFIVSFDPGVGEYDFTNCGEKSNFISTELLDLYHDRNIQSLIEDQRESIYAGVFFSGNFDNERHGIPQRSLYLQHAADNPEYFKFRSTSNIQKDDVEPPISLCDHKDYEYLIDLMGHVYSSRSLWLLLSRRAFFASPYDNYIHYWEYDLEGFTHFIPVEKDLSDLTEKYVWANRNQSKVDKIIESAYEYGIKNFSYESIAKRTIAMFESSDIAEHMLEMACKKISNLNISMADFLSYNKLIIDDYNKINPDLYTITDKLSEVGNNEVYYNPEYHNDRHIINYINFYFPNSRFL